MTTVTRILNFSSGPAVLPVPVLEQVQRDLLALPGVGMSVMEISHRSATFESILEKAEADIRALAGIPANYKVLFLQGGASLQFSMVPLNLLGAGATADYVMTGTWADKAAKEARRVGTVNETRLDQGRQLQPHPDRGRVCVHAGRGLRAHHLEQHDRRHRVAHAARRRRRAARRGRLLRHLQPPDRHHEVRADLRRRSEEPRAVRRHARHRPRRPARALEQVAAHDAELRRARGERVAVQHAAGLRRSTCSAWSWQWLRAQGGLAAMGDINERKAGKLYAELDRTGFWKPTAQKESRSLMNVTFRLAQRGPREALREGIDRRRPRRAQGSPVRRRHARLDLQRVPGERRRHARRVHAGVRAAKRLAWQDRVTAADPCTGDGAPVAGGGAAPGRAARPRPAPLGPLLRETRASARRFPAPGRGSPAT